MSNLLGAHIFAWVITNAPVFQPPVHNAMLSLARDALHVTFGVAVLRGIFAGWLIALVVWMLVAVDSGKLAIIVILTYVVGLAHLTHIVAGSIEVLVLPMSAMESWWNVVGTYLVPTLIGNILGGTSLTAALNHAQVVAGSPKKQGSLLVHP